MKRRHLLGAIALSLALAACGAGGAVGSTTTTEPTTTSKAEVTTSLQPTTTTSAEGDTSTTLFPADLPGEPVEFGPTAGETVAVVGVRSDDVLNLRAAPGADQPVLAEIPPLYDSLTALGQTRQVPGSMWVAVEYDDTVGWVNLGYIAYLGTATDATGSVLDDLGTSPAAETIEGLGSIVIETFSSDDLFSEAVLASTRVTSSTGEVIYDVIGSEDDSVRGVRVAVTGRPYSGGFTLDGVETTTLCSRGVTADGVCF